MGIITCRVRGRALLLGVRTVRIKWAGLGTNGAKNLEDIVHSLQPIQVECATGDADLFLGQLVVVAHELDEAEFLIAPNIASKPGDRLFVGVQEDEVPVFESCMNVRRYPRATLRTPRSSCENLSVTDLIC